MTRLLEKALQKVGAFPQDEHKSSLLSPTRKDGRSASEKRDVIRRLAGEALEEDAPGETLPPDDLI